MVSCGAAVFRGGSIASCSALRTSAVTKCAARPRRTTLNFPPPMQALVEQAGSLGLAQRDTFVVAEVWR